MIGVLALLYMIGLTGEKLPPFPGTSIIVLNNLEMTGLGSIDSVGRINVDTIGTNRAGYLVLIQDTLFDTDSTLVFVGLTVSGIEHLTADSLNAKSLKLISDADDMTWQFIVEATKDLAIYDLDNAHTIMSFQDSTYFIGINRTNPAYDLDVNGDVRVVDSVLVDYIFANLADYITLDSIKATWYKGKGDSTVYADYGDTAGYVHLDNVDKFIVGQGSFNACDTTDTILISGITTDSGWVTISPVYDGTNIVANQVQPKVTAGTLFVCRAEADTNKFSEYNYVGRK